MAKPLQNVKNTFFQIKFNEICSFFPSRARNERLLKVETEKILKNILDIESKSPELSKFLTEIPENFGHHFNPKITLEDLKEYNASLKQIFKNYQNKKEVKSSNL